MNLAHIKRDLAEIGVENAVVRHKKYYKICRDEIECDLDLFNAAAREFSLCPGNGAAQKIISLYKGEYLPDFEAFWAVAERIKYREIFKEALKYCQEAG